MLTGENGILTKADNARKETQRADIIERARVKILEKQTENFGTLTEQELTDILTPTYGTLLDNGEETILDKILMTIDNKYEIPVKEIWNGNLKQEDKIINFEITMYYYPEIWFCQALEGENWSQWVERNIINNPNFSDPWGNIVTYSWGSREEYLGSQGSDVTFTQGAANVFYLINEMGECEFWRDKIMNGGKYQFR